MRRTILACVAAALLCWPAALAAAATAPGRVGSVVLRLTDASRTRTLVTTVRYPAGAARPLPLVVFGHGFAVTAAPYAALLDAWARAGYVVAAPLFPLERAGAPGGPNEADLVNEPADLRFVITRLLAASATAGSRLAGLIDPARIAVAGQSDGGAAALTAAYAARGRDPRVRAAVILSGSEIPGLPLAFERGSPPLLATQGTADTVNPPVLTSAFYDRALRPKYLLRLLGAAHLPPYTTQQPQLGVVERVTIAFLDRYLGTGSLQRLVAAGAAPGVARLEAHP